MEPVLLGLVYKDGSLFAILGIIFQRDVTVGRKISSNSDEGLKTFLVTRIPKKHVIKKRVNKLTTMCIHFARKYGTKIVILHKAFQKVSEKYRD